MGMWIGLLVGGGLGAAVVYWYLQTKARKPRRIPKQWPIRVRSLVSSNERRVWSWLTKVMFDQHILIKLPVTRFTAPRPNEDSAHWYRLLNGIYCTFTVCNLDGVVIGCVDAPGSQGLSISNQTLKHSLLTQLGIRYWVLTSSKLPHPDELRAAMLGEQAVKGPQRDQLNAQFQDVRENLQAAVTRRRHGKSERVERLESEIGNAPEFLSSRIASGWEQNSFAMPLDSRSAPLDG